MKIVELMNQSSRDLLWLQNALQAAIELELSTLPPYLCGYWALKDKNSSAANQIYRIVVQEMLHFGFACNMLSATGKMPEIIEGYGNITYPGPLPGGVVPKCDPHFIPCDPNFKVVLGFPDFKSFALMGAHIEYPENPAPRPVFAAAETFPSIGEFYDALLDAFRTNDSRIPYLTANQRKGALGLSTISKLSEAIAAIQLIQRQGEGGDRNPYYGGNNLSHFYTFGEFYFGKKYVYDVAMETGNWIGDPLTITDAEVYKMTPVPPGGYPAPPRDVIDSDQTFKLLLTQLESAWSGGGSKAFSEAIQTMKILGQQATALLAKEIPRTDNPGIYGPQFRIAFAAGSSGKQLAAAITVSFAGDIKPLFRSIDIQHMTDQGYQLDDYTFMSDPTGNHANANEVLSALKGQRMPPGGPFWTQAQLDLFSSWMSAGYQP
jgi:hypothetical protein